MGGDDNLTSNLMDIINASYGANDINDNPMELMDISNGYHDTEDILQELTKTNKSYKLKIMHLNIQGLQSKFDDLKLFLDNVKIKFDIILLCETFLKDINADNFQITGYNFIYKNRKTVAHGGVAMYIRDSLMYIPREDLVIFNEGTFESIFIEITNKNKSTIIGEIYRTPSSNEQQSLLNYEIILNKLNNISKDCIIGTDQNFDYLRVTKHKNTQELLNMFFDNKMVPTIIKPTRITTKTATLIDNLYLKCDKHLKIQSGIICTDLSDHYPIYMCYGSGRHNNQQSTNITTRPINTVTENKLKDAFEQIKWNKLHNMETNDAYECFIKTTTDVIDLIAPEKIIKIRHKNKIREKWMTKGLLKSSQTKEKLYKLTTCKHRQTIDMQEKSKIDYIKYRNIFNKLKRTAKSKFYENLLQQSKNDMRNTWKAMKMAMNKSSDKSPMTQSIKYLNKTITQPQDICNAFCDYFTNVGPDFASRIGKSKYDHKHYMRKRNAQSMFMNPTDPEEIFRLISNLKPKSSSGHDNISSKLLKILSHQLKIPISIIINKSITSGIFPNAFKIAKVVPIHKGKSKEEISNYRPISLLSTFSKILEKIIHKRLYAFMQINKAFYNSQYGFRNQHSTIDATTELIADITDNLENKMMTLCTYLDLSKAFDTIDHSLLIDKLEHYGIRGNCLNWFKSYLCNRSQFVKIDNTVSDTQQIVCGVPQGSVLGPLLFIIYTNDLPNSLTHTNAILFADDTTIYTKSNSIVSLYEKVNYDLNSLHDWFKTNKLSLNVGKTNYMLFGNTIRVQPDTHLHKILIGTDEIMQKKSVKFLGVTIDDRLNWQDHIISVKNKMSRTLYNLKMIKNILPSYVLKTLYMTLLQPYMDYGIILWGATNQCHLNKLNVIQKKAIRVITNSKYNEHTAPLFKELSLLKLTDIYKLNVGKFMYKMVQNNLPPQIKHAFTKNQDLHNHNTRQGVHIKTRRTKMAASQIIHKGPEVWLSVPVNIQTSKTIKQFKYRYKMHLQQATL